MTAINSNDCATAWDLIWPWAQKGNLDARAVLATSIFVVQLTPPGICGDAISRFRHSVILAVHGATNGDPAATELLHALIKTKQIMAIGGGNLTRCFEMGKPPRLCVEEAVANGFVPSFEDYSKEIEIISASPNSHKASCNISVGVQDLPTQKLDVDQ
ncbi:MAG: hypothetical protein GY799_23735 [Desulfobulbaceae bacterium]|nr:hypothetical protein [Desulfobulbaceae bacterium]